MTTTKSVRLATAAGWVLAVVVAFLFLGAGVTKLIGDPAQVQLFDAIGAGQWLRYVVGGCEAAGAIGVLIPRVRAVAGIGLTLVMVGAVITNLVIIHQSPLVPLVFGVLTALLAFFRRGEISRVLRGRAATPAAASPTS